MLRFKASIKYLGHYKEFWQGSIYQIFRFSSVKTLQFSQFCDKKNNLHIFIFLIYQFLSFFLSFITLFFLEKKFLSFRNNELRSISSGLRCNLTRSDWTVILTHGQGACWNTIHVFLTEYFIVTMAWNIIINVNWFMN